ncbi:MAG: UvrD-helicase domain-containing protein [candidate division Zixibacteria bacterium]|nr:UvrD-helicase domain-containing protein [candidate division Zixibacteria bacterium]
MNRLLENLNPAQLEAVTTTEGPLLIVAGAGSGKTRALTTRVAYLLEQRLAEPHEIIAVTFTNKAAREMRERVRSMLGVDLNTLTISTFHSFCARLLRIEAEAIGYPRNFVIYDSDDSKQLMKRCVLELGLSGNQFGAPALCRKVSNIKNTLQSAEEYAAKADGYFDTRTAQAFTLYERRLKGAAALDFDDLILKSVRMLEENGPIRKKYQRRFKYVMVDEYQDTNHSQYRLLKALTGPLNNICVVGDEDQSIYGWRGADIRNIRDFEKDFPGGKIVTLDQNYRSTQTILDAAGSVIANNSGRKDKHLKASAPGGEQIRLLLTDTAEHEAESVVGIIDRLRASISLKEIVTLYRTSAQSRSFENALIKHKIPYHIVGGASFYQLKEIKDLIAYLKLIDNVRDDVSFERAIKFPKRGFGDSSLEKLKALAAESDRPLFAAAEDGEALRPIGPRPAKIAAGFVSMINEFRLRAGTLTAHTSEENSHHAPVDILIQELVEQAGFEKEIAKDPEGEIKAQARMDNVDEFVAAAIEFAKNEADPSLTLFLQEISLYTSVDTYREIDEKVTMMTIHAAKGLEFDAVFIVGLEEGLFPLVKAMDDPHEMEEERRLFYVAATRARRLLTLSAAQNRFRYGASESAQSRFISEITPELIDKDDRRSYVRSNYGRTSLRPGGRWNKSGAVEEKSSGVVYEYEEEEVMQSGRIVQHRVFGRGKVLSVDGRGEAMKINVQFTGIGKKTLIAKYAKLKVVG